MIRTVGRGHPDHPAPDRYGEAGAGSVTALATVLVVLSLLGAIATLGASAGSAARAASVADLAALAAADAARGLVPADPCTLSAQTAGRHGATVTGCTLGDGGTVTVHIRLDTGLPWPATAQSRAGPPTPVVPG